MELVKGARIEGNKSAGRWLYIQGTRNNHNRSSDETVCCSIRYTCADRGAAAIALYEYI